MKLQHLFAAAFAFALAITYSGVSTANTLDISDMDSPSAMSFGGGHEHGGHGGHGGGHGYGHRVTCTARNRHGRVFSARGNAMRRFEVQREALNSCRMTSHHCQATGCY